MDDGILGACLAGAFAGRISFPETVEKMIATGVERYEVDLSLLRKTCHGANGESYVAAIPLADAPSVAAEFSHEGVRAAIQASQRREIDYPEFLRRVMACGASNYTAYLQGRKVIYFGRLGDFHVEPFPPLS